MFARRPFGPIVLGALLLAACDSSAKVDASEELSHDTANPEAALGKNLEGPEVQALVGHVYQRCSVDAAANFACPALGIDLGVRMVNGDLIVSTIRLYPNASGRMSAHKGSLPGGLTGDMQAEGVHSKLGMPSASGADWDAYKQRTPGLFIKYLPPSHVQAGLISSVSLLAKP